MTVSVPTGWTVSTLGEIGKWGSGGTPSRSNSSFYIGSIPWFKTGELGPRVICKSEENISEEAIKASSAKIFPAGSIALAMYGATIGKTSILGLDAATNQACAVVVEDNQVVDKNYLFNYLKSQKDAFIDAGQGGAQPNISQTVIKAWPFPLAPLPEQRRIAEKLDTVLTRVDALNDRLARIIPLLKRFRQSVLAAATSGRLTEDWCSASDKNWKLSRVDEVAKVFLGRQRSPANHDGPYMRPYMRAANVTWSGWDLSDVKEMNFDNADFERYQLKKNDILLNEGSGSADEVGKPAIWNEEIEGCCFQNTLICVRPENIDTKFLFYVLFYSAISKIFVDNTRGVNIHHIGKQNMAAFSILVPDIPEQLEIVRRVEILFAYADRLEARLQTTRTAAERLTPALLAKAFRGELVPQDPNDEPATELLRRLREARAAEVPNKKPRGRKSVV